MSTSPSTDTPLLPAPITSLKLSVTKGATTYEQPITSGLTHVTNNQYQVKITNTPLVSAFNTEPHGTIFNPSIVVNYENEDFPSGNGVNFSSSLSYVPRQITPNFTFANISDKTTSDSPFSVSGLITKDGTGAVSYTSSNQAVATIHPSTGLVTIVGQGTTTITATLAASADLVYTAVPPIQKTLDVLIIPNFTFANIPDKTTSDSPFSVSGLITKDGTGAVSYTSSNQAVATIHPSTGLVTIVGKGTTTITATLAASADRVYTAVTPIQKTLNVTGNEILDLKRKESTYRLYYTLTSGLSADYVNSISLASNNGSGSTTPHPNGYGTISPNSYYLEFSTIMEPTYNSFFNFISLKNGDTELASRQNISITGGF